MAHGDRSFAGDQQRAFNDLLLNYVPPSILLAWAVNVGGFGLLPGSLANLIALRMANDRRIWWRFHLYSLPMLVWAALVGYGLLHLLGQR